MGPTKTLKRYFKALKCSTLTLGAKLVYLRLLAGKSLRRLCGSRESLAVNMVSRKEGRPLKVCVDKCSWKDWFKDFIGTAYEEVRETKEEYHDGMGATKRNFFNGCPQCCEKIPANLVCINEKIRKACPGLNFSKCRNGNGEN